MALLTQDSPRLQQTHGMVPLMPHQLAMLYRCLEIEETNDVSITIRDRQRKQMRYKLGVLADLPGSGKTYVILSLIMMDYNSINIVVVPQNIYSQWDDAIKTFCGGMVTYTKFITYNDVSALYFNPSVLNSQIILTTPMYYNVIIDALQGKRRISRIFIDEIDSVKSMISHRNVCDMLWFISASVTYRMISQMGFSFNSSSKGYNDMTYHENDTLIAALYKDISCRSDDNFVKASFNLPEPIYNIRVCHNVLVDTVLHGLVSQEEYDRLNAMDFNGINKLNSVSTAKDEKEAIAYFVKDLRDTSKLLKIAIEDTDKVLKSGTVSNTDDLEKLQISLEEKQSKLKEIEMKIECIRQRLEECDICNICYSDVEDRVVTVCCQNSYCKICLTTWMSKSLTKSCPTCRTNNVSVISVHHDKKSDMLEANNVNDTEETCVGCDNSSVDNSSVDDSSVGGSNQEKTKLEELESLLTSTLGDKIIIFADFTSVFKEIAKLLDKLEIKYIELDGGNIDALDKSITSYKNGDVRVLMTNSSLYGCGMNLQNTSDVVLLHKISPLMREQVIGRAQRPGRTSVLSVWELFHGNEVES
jgi:hypothetical protein